MSTASKTPAPSAAGGTNAAAAAPKKQQPSLYARKLLQKLSTLHSNASLESRQTIASWMVFNRKKCEGMGEGLLLATAESAAAITASGQDGANECNEAAARLMLLLRILHQVFMCNCPTASSSMAGAEGDADKWEKSSPLRTGLGEIAFTPLWKALAVSLNKLNDDVRDQYQVEIKGMIEDWKEHNVFGGPTVLEEYKKGWSRALKEAAETKEGESAAFTVDVGSAENTATATKESTKSVEEKVDETTEPSTQQTEEPSDVKESESKKESENVMVDTKISADDEVGKKQEEAKEEPSPEVSANSPVPSVMEESVEGSSSRASKRDSVASVDVEVDFEGVEEAKVKPSEFLDACKVIASIQITRDLGSDAAMNLSSALSSIPSEVEEACNKILTQQQNGQDETTPITELLPSDTLSNLPDEVLDLDLKYARQSLQNYKEAIRQQRKARLQCLNLLLQSRCSFGSLDAARAFCGAEDGMDAVLEKLKKRKEILVDAMALEGLDVEEDEEEKKMEEEEENLKPLDWFPGQSGAEDEEAGEEPAAKKIKSS